MNRVAIIQVFAAVTITAVTSLQSVSANPPLAFADKTLESWQQRSFEGHTEYTLVEDEGQRVLRANTDGQASVLYRQKRIDLKRTPWINWWWKVDHVYEGIDERSRAGDDYPARLYVVAKTGLLPWHTLSINYVWSSSSDVNTSWLNPYSDKAGMIAVQSGSALTGTWVTQRRNIVADFRAVFDRDIYEIRGYAVMVDGDNSGQKGTAWFGNIEFTDY